MTRNIPKKRNRIVLRRKELILGVLLFVVVGALVYRLSKTAGMAVTLTAVVVYLAVDMGLTYKRIRNFRSLGARGKIKLAMWGLMLFVAVSAWVGGAVSYFILLVLLAVDYMMSDDKNKYTW